MSASYDVVIAGAGAAGAVLAARLSEDQSRSVLLLEAGPDFAAVEDLPEEIRYAYGRDRNIWDRAFGLGTRFGWEYRARATDLRPDMFVPRGKIVGGSSAVNAQIFLRGVPEDYDSWAAAGNDLWSHDALLPFLCRLESDPDYGDAPYHGADGPIRARRFKDHELNPEHRAFYEAALAAGYPDCPDHNNPASTGVGPLALNNAESIRWSTNIGYLNPARGRPNLTIQANTHVHRVLFAGQRATGLLVEHDGALTAVHGGEIVLCGGAIGSPHLLLLSGVGPAAHLEAMGIDVVGDLPGVGQNLRDHPQVSVTLRAKDEYLGDGTEPRLQIGLRYTATGSDLRNDMFIIPASFATTEGYYVSSHSKPLGFYLVGCIYLAEGQGELKLASTDPHVQPVLDYNYLAEPSDRGRLRESIHIIIDLLKHDALNGLVAERIGPTDAELDTDAALDEWMRREVGTSHHVSSTCKMGPASDSTAVVDQHGRMHGLENLRVADAAIMPDCVRANTNITSMAIGERIADLMSMAALLIALVLLLATSPVRAQTEDEEHQKRLIDASREFVEMSKELSADGTISDHEVQQIRPLIIKLREIVEALPCGGSYDYFDLVGKQRLYKGPAPECRLIITKCDGLPWDAVSFPVPPDDQSTVTVTGPEAEPVAFSLYVNYPNPFNAGTQIVYTLSEAGPVELAIYNVRGQRVRTLVQSVQAAGRYQIAWDGRSDSGAALASGVYLSRLASTQGVRVRRLALIK